MILVLTKSRHMAKLSAFLVAINVKHEMVAAETNGRNFKQPDKYSLGVSYCWPYLVIPPMLYAPRFGWINYHPAPLPEYKGPKETTQAISDEVMYWGVTVHYMDEQFDTGPIIKVHTYPLWERPTSESELGAVAHWHLFKLFKDTIYGLQHQRGLRLATASG